MKPGALTVYRWELRKLRSQKRTYLGLGAAVARADHLRRRRGAAQRRPRGRRRSAATSTTSGLAIPLVLLLFGSIWMFPLITALVAGDIVASEDHNGTLKTILTRSLERGQIFTGKTLAARHLRDRSRSCSAAIVAIVAGCIVSGFNPLTTLSGTPVSATDGARARGREPARLPDADPRDRLHRPAALDGHAQQRRGGRRHADGLAADPADRRSCRASRALHPYLLSTQFNAWQGLLREPVDWAPIIRAAWVCALYALPSLFAAYLVFLRRDVAGG